MREIHDHKIASDTLMVFATDTPDAAGVQHRYVVSGFLNDDNPSKFTVDESATELVLLFQNGPIPEAGVNGITLEVLLAVVADRLRGFQASPFACHENTMALAKVEDAQRWLRQRTLGRVRRGVEGTHAI